MNSLAAPLRSALALLLFGVTSFAFGTTSATPTSIDRYGNSPILFEPNVGQVASQVRFLARGARCALYLTDEGATVAMSEGNGRAVAIKLTFIGGRTARRVSAEERLESRSNYFIGPPRKWRKNVANYERVRYVSVYPGVDVVFYGNQRQLEYDFEIAPGADPSQARLRIRGADRFSVERDGSLRIEADGRSLSFAAPYAYQIVNGQRRRVASRFVLDGKDQIGFAVGDYDRTQSLVIDPTLVYSSFLGGSNYESSYGVTVDASGNAYITGFTQSTDFPVTSGAYQFHPAGGFTYVFVTKVNASGSALVYSTYFGGSTGPQYGQAIAVDGEGNAYVGGFTPAPDFPTTPGAAEPTHAYITYAVGFLTKLNPTGSALVYSTYVGAKTVGGAQVLGVAVDGRGNAYITGQAWAGFPVTRGAFQTTFAGRGDAFVAKLNSTGTAYEYASYLGGGYSDQGNGIAVDGNGDAYVTGFTGCNRFPSTLTSHEPACGPPRDVFVVKINSTGTAMVYGTFLHAPGGFGAAIALDAFMDAYVTGYVGGPGMPVTPGAFQPTSQGGTDAFVAKLNPAGTALEYATYLGGNGQDQAAGIKVDLQGRAYVTGSVIGTTNFPVTSDAFQSHIEQGGNVLIGTSNAFLTQLNASGTGLEYSTYFGSEYTLATALALDTTNSVYMVGLTFPGNIPVTPNAFDRTGRQQDAFITKFAFGAGDCVPASAGAEICFPANRATVSSPVSFTSGARARPGTFLTAIRLYVDSIAKATTLVSGGLTQVQTTQSVSLPAGTHFVAVVAYQGDGSALSASEFITLN